ncbi:AraC-like DNA-binding protein [Pseudonocardia hierapolitana]|uniref:AraC-like DNA-binding protein n=1 Tax=Pseudonocardia hierapolitana TaxID=1128676 RepID=A0A561SXP5_9PSEU|nr:helix-turn-helix domain-containing protein [Pseudonocardia hierapolitana]TWF79612.1 AraC-like DNA-binding protein [Pseudonocardia hierapolitana]
MSVVLRAVDQPPAVRDEYWRRVVADSIVPMDVWLADGPGARDEMEIGSAGAVSVVRSSAGPGEARRTARHIRRCDPGLYQLFVQVHGTGLARQNGHETELVPGDVSLTDLSRPFHCVHPARTAILLRFPRSMLPLPERHVAAVAGARIPGDRGLGALVSNLARQIPPHLDHSGATRLGTALLDLLTVAIGTSAGHCSAVPAETHQRALLVRLHSFIERHIADPDLTPASIADAHHISVRYLHKVFRSEQTTVAAHIRRRRLERCSRDLIDPASAQRPVGEIARTWGFTSAAHFSRLFRDTYGLPPSEFRIAHGRSGAGSHRAG